MMNVYKTIIILNANMSTEETEEEIKKYTDMMQDWNKTKKVKTENMGEKKLAYDIRGHKTGYYCLFTYQCHPEHITELEKQLRIDDNVLKFMTIRLDGETIELEDYDPDENSKSEQEDEKPDALDVLLGFADYKKERSEKHGTSNIKRCHSKT